MPLVQPSIHFCDEVVADSIARILVEIGDLAGMGKGAVCILAFATLAGKGLKDMAYEDQVGPDIHGVMILTSVNHLAEEVRKCLSTCSVGIIHDNLHPG